MSELRALAHRETATAPDAAQHPASSTGPRPVRIGSASPPLRVGVLVERRYLSQAQPSGLVAALRARGCRVRVIDPEASAVRVGDDRWLKGLDLIIARGRSWGLLCRLSCAEALGVPTIHRRAAIAAVHNKAEMAVALAAAGVPTPRTYLGPARRLGGRLRRSGRGSALVLKPVFGDNGRGLRVVRERSALERIRWPEPVALAQELVAGDGRERKLYGIGDQVWAVERAAPLAAGRASARRPAVAACAEGPVATPAELALAAACRRIFGLDLYGIDCIPAAGGPVVIEVNEFPNYTGVPASSERLAEFVVRRASRAVERRP